MKSFIRSLFIDPVNLTRFEKILTEVGEDPAIAKAVKTTAVTVGIPFTAEEEAQEQIRLNISRAEQNRQRAPQIEEFAKERADALRQQAQEIENQGRMERETLERNAENQESRAEELAQKMNLLS